MSLTQHRRFVRVTVAGNVVKTLDGVSVTESLDNLCTVCEFTLAAQPSPEPTEGDSVLIEWLDLDAMKYWPMFGGTISAIDIESEPWQMDIRCVDQLELLRKVRDGSDLVFGDPSGTPAMTEGQALMAVLDDCGIAYNSADIADSGYVLGVKERVSWLNDLTTTGAQIVAELNRVFRMALFTVGDNRVIRIPYDPAPDDATGLYKTYTKAVNIDFQAHHRTHGDRDRVQNVWVVRGATVELPNSCTATPWAKAIASGRLVGKSSKATVAQQEFQSDLIQDEGLAEAIVRSQMAQTNRLPDEGSATLETDPNVHQGSKIAIVDGTYGITANPRYFLVTSVQRSGTSMTLDLTAGPGGSAGTVTHGVDKVCTDVHTGVDWPGDFTFPDFSFPPIDLGLDLGLDFTLPDFSLDWSVVGGTDPSTDGGGGGGTGGPCDFLGVASINRWVEVNPTFSTGTGDLVATVQGAARMESPVVDLGADWTLDATATILAGASNHDISIGVGTPSASLAFGVNLLSTAGGYLYANFDDYTAIPGAGWTDGTPIDIALVWDAATLTISATVTQGARTETASVTQTGATYTYSHYPMIASAGTSGDSAGVDVSAFSMSQDSNDLFCNASLLTADGWHTVAGSVTYGSDSISSTGSGGDTESFYNGDGYPFNLTTRARFSGRAHFSSAGVGGTDAPICQVGFGVADGSHFTGLEVQWDPNFAPDATINTYVNGVYQTSFTIAQTTAVAGWDFWVLLDGPAGTVTMNWNGGAQTWSGGIAAQPDSELAVRFFSGTAIGFGIDNMSLEVG